MVIARPWGGDLLTPLTTGPVGGLDPLSRSGFPPVGLFPGDQQGGCQTPSRSSLRGFCFSQASRVCRVYPLHRKLFFSSLFDLLSKLPGLMSVVQQAIEVLMKSPLPDGSHPHPQHPNVPKATLDCPPPVLLKTDDSYSCSLKVMGTEAKWLGLGQIGGAQITESEIINAFDHTRFFKRPKGNLQVTPSPTTQALTEMTNELVSTGCAVELPHGTTPNMNISIRMKPSGKPLVIADCRALIDEAKIAPARFVLPDTEKLLCFQGDTTDLFATKLDLSNAYWSTRLPKKLPPIFKFQVGDRCFALVVLPFGWSHSPVIFQRRLGKSLSEVLDGVDGILFGQYLDDMLLIGRGFDKVKQLTAELINKIHSEGWLLNMTKCVVIPTKKIDWLGKLIEITDKGIRVSVKSSTIVNIVTLFLFVCAKVRPARILRSLTGLLSWAGLHSRLCFPFLHASHSFVCFPHTPFAPRQVRLQLVKAIGMLVKVVSKPAIVLGVHTCASVPWVFVDAAAEEGFGGIVLSWMVGHGRDTMITLPLPGSMIGADQQQLAELYMIKRGIQYAKSFGLSSFAVISDNLAGLHSTKKMSTGVQKRKRTQKHRQLVDRARLKRIIN